MSATDKPPTNSISRRDFARLAAGGAVLASLPADKPSRVCRNGVDANYAYEMTGGDLKKTLWSSNGKSVRLFPFFHSVGVEMLRLRLWTCDKGPGSLEVVTRIAKAGMDAGLKPHVVFFLSDDFSDTGKAPLAKRWSGLTEKDRATAIKKYSEESMRQLVKAGVHSAICAVGNESDLGLAGVFDAEALKQILVLIGRGFPIFGEPGKPGSPEALALLDRLKKGTWPRLAALARACATGIHSADPSAKLLMHVGLYREPVFCHDYFSFMREHGVPLNYAGLSYYPAALGEQDYVLTRKTVTHLAETLKLPSMLCESAYPSSQPVGYFAFMHRPMDRFPFTLKGQRDWLLDHLRWTSGEKNIVGSVYWSPEWYVSRGIWDAFALFDTAGAAKPAMEAYVQFKAERRT